MKRRMIKKVLAAMLSLSLAASMCACAVVTSEESTGTKQEAESEEPSSAAVQSSEEESQETVEQAENAEPALSGELEVQIFTNESESANSAWERIISAFEEATGVEVIVNMGSQVNSQMDTRWMQGNPPDFVYLNGAGLSDVVYEQSGLFRDITSVMQDGYVYGTDKKIADVVDANSMIYGEGGKIYRAPLGRTTHGLWYDAKFLEDNGFTVPSNYTEFVEVSQKAVDMGIAPFTYAGQYPTYLAGLIFPAIGAYGQDYFTQVFSADPEALASENMTSVLQRWADYCATEGFILPGTTTLDHTTSQIKWLGHETLFLPVGMWLPEEVRTATPEDFEMTYTVSPLIEEGQPTTAVYGATYTAIASEAKNPENAEAFLRFLYTDEVQTIMMTDLAQISVRSDLDYEAATANIYAPIASAMKVASAAENQVYNRATWKDTGTLFYNLLNELALGDITVEDAQAQLVAAAEKEQEGQ